MTDLKSPGVIVVTGGSRGIGAATCRLAHAAGYQVVFSYNSNADAAAAVVADCDGAAIAVQADVRHEADAANLFDAAEEAFGPATVLVNNAGVSGAGRDRFEEPEGLDAWRQIMSINLDAVNLGCRMAIQEMKVTGGSIVNISSVMGLVGGAGPAYNASKGGVRLLTKSIASYCGRMGYPIRCNSVHPGYIWTPMVRQIAEVHEEVETEEALKEMLLLQHPIGRLGEPDDIANGIRFLISDESSFMTGSELVIDGGYTCV